MTTYHQALMQMEERLQQAVKHQTISFMAMQHPLVYTAGLTTKQDHILSQVEVVRTRRGGSITLHNPGQLVFYTVLPLSATQGLESFIRLSEEAMLKTFEQFGYSFFRKPPHSGIWTTRGKIAFIGLALKQNCIYHGLALNLLNSLEPYQKIHSCGITLPVTRLVDFSGDLQKNLIEQAEATLQSFSYQLFKKFKEELKK